MSLDFFGKQYYLLEEESKIIKERNEIQSSEISKAKRILASLSIPTISSV